MQYRYKTTEDFFYANSKYKHFCMHTNDNEIPVTK